MFTRLELPSDYFHALLVGKEEFSVDSQIGRLQPILLVGRLFESFMCAGYGDGEGIRYSPYLNEALRKAIDFAIAEGNDNIGLAKKLCYANVMFSEIKRLLPSKSRSRLKMYSVMGTSLDRDYCVDLLFVLDGLFIGVDYTIDAFHFNEEINDELLGRVVKKKKKEWVLEFTNFHIAPRMARQFVKKVVHELRFGEFKLPARIYKKLYGSDV